MQKQALTVNEAAEYSSISRSPLRTLIGSGKIPLDTLSRAEKRTKKVVPNLPQMVFTQKKSPISKAFFHSYLKE